MSMPGYTKLFNSILASTIWRAPNTTRIVWITMLAMADKDGIVEGSVPGLADFARVEVEEARQALAELLAPDPDSRTGDHEGRRIEVVDGTGWRLLNHGKYRAKMSEDERREYNRQKQAEWRTRKKPSNSVNDSQSQSAKSAQAEAHSKAEAKTHIPSPKGGGIVEGKDSSRVPTTPQSKRVAAIFRRREDTAWSGKEIAAYKKLGTLKEEDLSTVEAYYKSGAEYLRRDLYTFLNNFAGELDRARAWRGQDKGHPTSNGSQGSFVI